MEHNQIHFKAEFIINEGKKEEYKKLIQEMSRMVEANDVLFMKRMRIQRQH